MISTATKRCVVTQTRRLPLVSNSRIRLRHNGNAPLLSGLRWHSGITGACPYHNNKADATISAKPRIELFEVPRLPIVGSLIPQHSNAPQIKPTNTYDYWYESREKFGDFYCVGIPTFGKGITGDTYIMTDPNEFMKILRQEGEFPAGITEVQWPLVQYFKDAAARSSGAGAGYAIFSRGEEWQRSRRFMQTDLLHPSAAKGYVPGMIRACQIASEGAPLFAKNMKTFTASSSFDMFSSVMFGEMTGLAGGNSDNAENERFCEVSLAATKKMNPMVRDPVTKIKKKLGIKTKDYATFEANMDESRRIATSKMKEFKRRKEKGELSEFEQNSYASRAIDRFLASAGEEGALQEDEVTEILVVALIAAMDTTSSMLNWCLIHLAMNPDIQEELRKEVEANVAKEGGSLTVDCFTKSNNVYLDAFLRENHRMTKPVGVNTVKENVTNDVELHGTVIPKGNVFILESRSVGMDPKFVKDPDVFDPSRWFKAQVQKRKGTPAEILDHPLYNEPFSAGARKCPGFRVARYEVRALLSQLVLDWEISLADNDEAKPQSWRDIRYFNGLTVQPEIPELSFKSRR